MEQPWYRLGIEADSRSSADPDETPEKAAANRTGPGCRIMRTEPDETPAKICEPNRTGTKLRGILGKRSFREKVD